MSKGWFRIGAIYAVIGCTEAAASEIIEKISALSALVDVDNLMPGDCYDIYQVWAKYDALDDTIKSAVTNAGVLEEIKTSFDAKFDVEIIFDGTEAGFDGEILSKTSVTTSYEEDEVYGNYLKITGNADKQSGAYFNIVSEKDYSGYTIFAPVQTSRDSRKWYYSTTSKSGYSAL